MARYLSPEWVASFDAALGALDLSDAVAAAGAGSLAAADGTFSVAQVVTDVPGGTGEAADEVRVVLTVADGRARLVLDPGHELPGTATIALAYGVSAVASAADFLSRRRILRPSQPAGS